MVALKPELLAHLSFRFVSEEHLVFSFDIPQPSLKPCRILQFHVRCFESGRVTVNSGLSPPVSSIFHLVSVLSRPVVETDQLSMYLLHRLVLQSLVGLSSLLRLDERL